MPSEIPTTPLSHSDRSHGQTRSPNATRHSISDYALATLAALGGLVFLGTMQVAPSKSDDIAILIYPPWVSTRTISSGIAALNLPLRDIRWNGRIIAVDLSDPAALTRNQLRGWYHGAAIRIAGNISSGCASIGD